MPTSKTVESPATQNSCFTPPTQSSAMNVSDSPQSLPTSTSFVDSLITEIASFNSPRSSTRAAEQVPPRPPPTPAHEKQPQNVLAGLSPSELARIKPIILTLHCLFPNDLLPALDILDRRLVHRLVPADSTMTAAPASGHTTVAEQDTETDAPIPDAGCRAGTGDIFLVTSASAAPLHPPGLASTTPATTDQDKGYEVRLHAWNCTCPTFAFSAFRDLPARLPAESSLASDMSQIRHDSVVYPFGGTLPCATDRASPPVCKHILACVLFARCSGLFGGHGDGSRRVSMEELAGWCAGWGG